MIKGRLIMSQSPPANKFNVTQQPLPISQIISKIVFELIDIFRSTSCRTIANIQYDLKHICEFRLTVTKSIIIAIAIIYQK